MRIGGYRLPSRAVALIAAGPLFFSGGVVAVQDSLPHRDMADPTVTTVVTTDAQHHTRDVQRTVSYPEVGANQTENVLGGLLGMTAGMGMTVAGLAWGGMAARRIDGL